MLRAELTNRYGVRFTEIVNGQAEIAGIPPVLLERFSKRTVEIERALHRKLDEFHDREGRDPTRFERAALEREAAADTRAHKTGHGVADLRTPWISEAAELGVTPHSLVASIVAAAGPAVEEPAVTVESVVDALSGGSSACPDSTVSPQPTVSTDDATVIEGTYAGTNTGPFGTMAATGRAVSVPYAAVFKFDNAGKVISYDVYYDMYSLLAQLGQVPALA